MGSNSRKRNKKVSGNPIAIKVNENLSPVSNSNSFSNSVIHVTDSNLLNAGNSVNVATEFRDELIQLIEDDREKTDPKSENKDYFTSVSLDNLNTNMRHNEDKNKEDNFEWLEHYIIPVDKTNDLISDTINKNNIKYNGNHLINEYRNTIYIKKEIKEMEHSFFTVDTYGNYGTRTHTRTYSEEDECRSRHVPFYHVTESSPSPFIYSKDIIPEFQSDSGFTESHESSRSHKKYNAVPDDNLQSFINGYRDSCYSEVISAYNDLKDRGPILFLKDAIVHTFRAASSHETFNQLDPENGKSDLGIQQPSNIPSHDSPNASSSAERESDTKWGTSVFSLSGKIINNIVSRFKLMFGQSVEKSITKKRDIGITNLAILSLASIFVPCLCLDKYSGPLKALGFFLNILLFSGTCRLSDIKRRTKGSILICWIFSVTLLSLLLDTDIQNDLPDFCKYFQFCKELVYGIRVKILDYFPFSF